MEHQIIIPQTDPKANYLAHKAEIDAAIGRVLDSGWYILGQEVAAFEQEFADYIGVRYAIGVASGTDALEIALRACGIEPGDVVFTVSHTAVATVAAIELVSATPVLVDIDPATFTMEPNCLEEAIKKHDNSRLRAIIPVHLYGHPADMSAILDIARRYDLRVIEDCAQAHGAALQDRKVGNWGHIAAFSFYPTKNLGAFGDGGMVVTDDPELAEQAHLLREYGWRERYVSEVPGMNSRLDALQAAILRVKLHYLDDDVARRRANAALYNRLLAPTGLQLPSEVSGTRHAFHQYVIQTTRRDDLQVWLRAHRIGTLVHYPVPVHVQPAYLGRLGKPGSFPCCELAAKRVLSLPLFPELDSDRIQHVAQLIEEWQKSSQP